MMGEKDSLFIIKFQICLIKEQYIENIQLTGYREYLNQGGVF